MTQTISLSQRMAFARTALYDAALTTIKRGVKSPKEVLTALKDEQMRLMSKQPEVFASVAEKTSLGLNNFSEEEQSALCVMSWGKWLGEFMFEPEFISICDTASNKTQLEKALDEIKSLKDELNLLKAEFCHSVNKNTGRDIARQRQLDEMSAEIMFLRKKLKDIESQQSELRRDVRSYHGQNPEWESLKLVDLDLSVRALNCLKAADIVTLGQLSRITMKELKKLRNIGARTLSEIRDLLIKNGATIIEQ